MKRFGMIGSLQLFIALSGLGYLLITRLIGMELSACDQSYFLDSPYFDID
ncbi:hypothetical protein M3182_08410 [Mesobacillus maritimus]|nr:hypothetical protein [Mesobacillus maritimus]MCM3585767.1 hypothetical protein [Mesobacillus maritimus]MCM3670525.1 hypothetical protein [Mesobacillus maritimus]